MPRDFARIPLAHGRRKVALHLAGEIRVVGQVGIEQVIAEPDLAVGQHHGELGPRQAEALLAPLGELVVAGQELDGAIEMAAALERADQALVFGEALGARAARAPTAPGSAGSCCAGPARRLRRSCWRAVCRAPPASGGPCALTSASRILMFTSTSEVLTPAELSMKSVLMRPPDFSDPPNWAYSTRPALRAAEIAAFADHPGADLAAVGADGVVGAVAHLGMRFVVRLHVGADAAVPQQVHAACAGWRASLRPASRRPPRARAALRASADSGMDLALRGHTPPPREISLRE